MYIYICVYIYIYRGGVHEREVERTKKVRGRRALTHDFVKDLEEPRDVRDLAGSEADALIKDNLRTGKMRWVVVVVGHGQQRGAWGGSRRLQERISGRKQWGMGVGDGRGEGFHTMVSVMRSMAPM